jgi:hypothetical protein
MPYITLDKAALAFGHVALLDKVAFQLDENERVGLIGRNGGGKSSLLRVIAGQAALGRWHRLAATRRAHLLCEPGAGAESGVNQCSMQWRKAWASCIRSSPTTIICRINWPSRMPITKHYWRRCSLCKPRWKRRTAGQCRRVSRRRFSGWNSNPEAGRLTFRRSAQTCGAGASAGGRAGSVDSG